MTDRRDIAVRPDRGFEERLEAELVARLFDRSATRAEPAGSRSTSPETRSLEDMMAVDLDEPAQATKPHRSWLAVAAAAVLAIGAGAVIVAQRDDQAAADPHDVAF